MCRLTRSRWPNLNWGSPATKQPLKQAGPRAKHRALRWPIDATITCGAWLFQAPALQSTPSPVPAATRAASPAAAIGATAAQDAVMFAGCQPPWAFVYKLVFRKGCRCPQAEKKSTSFLPVAPSKPRSLHLAIVVRLVLTTADADCDPCINPSAAAPASIPSTTLTFFLKRYPGLEPTILLLTNTNSFLFPLLLQSLNNRQHARPHAAVCRFGRRWPCHAVGQ